MVGYLSGLHKELRKVNKIEVQFSTRVRRRANHGCVENDISVVFFCYCCFLFSESFVKLFIWGKNLKKKEEEAMEEILTQVVEKYVKCNEFSKDNIEEDLKSFTDHIVKVYGVLLVTVGNGSVIIILDCPTLDSLEHCLLYTSPSPRDLSTSRMPSSA